MSNPFNRPAQPPPAAEEPAPAPAPVTAPDAPEPATRQIESVPTSMWTVAGYLVLLLLLGLGGYELYQQKQANDRLVRQLDEATTAAEAGNSAAERQARELNRTQGELAAARLEMNRLQEQQREAQDAREGIEAEMRRAIASKDVAISELEGRLTLSILDRILFDSGKSVIKPEGEDVLRKIATALEQFPGRPIHVTGHTDNVPINTSQYPSNWELSAARALAAVRFLVEQGGTKPDRIAAVAHGEFQPVAENTTPEGRARNRRIAIVLLPEVFKSPEATNAPVREPAPATSEFPVEPPDLEP